MSVTRNSLQERFAQQRQEGLVPDPHSRLSAPCRIVRVYDIDTLEEHGVPSELAGFLESQPGSLFAKVEILASGTQIIVPFEAPEELIYAVYGNAVQLENRIGTIFYSNLDIRNGVLSLQRTFGSRHISLSQQAQILDIGNLV